MNESVSSESEKNLVYSPEVYLFAESLFYLIRFAA